MSGRTSLTVYPGMSGMMENAFINVKNRSFSISADVHIPSSGASGVILAQGGRFGGWSGFVTATPSAMHRKPRHAMGSCRCDGTLPLCSSFGAEDPQGGSGDEVALKVEGVVDRAVHAQETLGGSS